MENAERCRAIALICRQQAGLHHDQHWQWLAQAERWEHLAEADAIQRDVIQKDVIQKGDQRRPSPRDRSARRQARHQVRYQA